MGTTELSQFLDLCASSPMNEDEAEDFFQTRFRALLKDSLSEANVRPRGVSWTSVKRLMYVVDDVLWERVKDWKQVTDTWERAEEEFFPGPEVPAPEYTQFALMRDFFLERCRRWQERNLPTYMRCDLI
jgi:hypothetical protein